MLYAIIALLLLVSIAFIITIIRYKALEDEQYDKVEGKVKEKLEEYREVSHRVIEAVTEEDRARKELDKHKQELESVMTTIDKMIEDGKKIAQREVDEQIDLYKQQQTQAANYQHQQYVIEIQRQQEEIAKQTDILRAQLYDFEAKRNAIVEAQKRELELQNERDFHNIVLSKNAVEDIKYLENVLDKLHNREFLAKLIWEAYLQKPTKEMLNRIIGSEKVCGIYRITNVKNNMCYIGQGVDVANRLTQHVKGSLGIQSIADQKVHHAMADEGIENWTFELLESCPKEKLSELEKYWIAYYKSNEFGYNVTKGG